MKTQLYHAHEGPCSIPPGFLKWNCPYGTKQDANLARNAYYETAIAYAYHVLANLSTADFGLGGDKPARQTLKALYATVTQDPLDDALDEISYQEGNYALTTA